MKFDKQRIGKRIASLRIDKGWNQRDLAAAANISLSAVARYESGYTGPSFEAALKLAEALDCSLETLACINEKE